MERHWIITHADGQTEVVRGPGVVGDQPLLEPGASYTYSSGAVIPTPVGTMQGDYLFVSSSGERFIVHPPVEAGEVGEVAQGAEIAVGKRIEQAHFDVRFLIEQRQQIIEAGRVVIVQ